MKKLYAVLCAVLLTCVIGTVVFLILSPDRIPVHYNFAGEVDRIGSKYENLLFPGLVVVMAAVFLLIARFQRIQGHETNERIILYVGVCTLIFFTLLGFYFMWKAVKYDPSAAPPVSFDAVNRFVSIGIGALLVVMGNVMPKARRNSLFGLRTKWSMANDTVWQKSQRFGGITLVIAGFSMILLSLFIPGIWNVLMMTAVLAVAAVLSAVASYRYYRADKEENTK